MVTFLGMGMAMIERMAQRVIPNVGWLASEIRSVAQGAESARFEAIFSAEVNNDVLATAQLMATPPRRSRSEPGSPVAP